MTCNTRPTLLSVRQKQEPAEQTAETRDLIKEPALNALRPSLTSTDKVMGPLIIHQNHLFTIDQHLKNDVCISEVANRHNM